MNTPEQAVIEGTVNPFKRLLHLFAGAYVFGIFHPLPEYFVRLFSRLATGLDADQVTHIHNRLPVDFGVIPMIDAFFSDTILASGLVSIFCLVCSALDRWNMWKVTILGGWSTFLVCAIKDWNSSSGPLVDTGIYLLLMAMFFTVVPAMRRR